MVAIELPPRVEPTAPSHPDAPLVVGSDDVDSQAFTQSGEVLDAATLAGAPSEPPGRAWPNDPSAEEVDAGSTQPPPTASEALFQSESYQRTRRRTRGFMIASATVMGLSVIGLWLTSDGSTSKSPPQNITKLPDDVPADPIEDPAATDHASATEAPLQDPVSPPEDGTTTPPGPPSPSTADMAHDQSASTVPGDLLPVDPLSGESLASPRDPASPIVVPRQPGAEEPSTAAPLMDLPPELAMFVDLLDMPGQAPDAPPIVPNQAAASQVLLDEAAEEVLDPMLIATPPTDINLDNAMKLRIAVSTKGYPLADVALVVGELTQVPVQLDWVSLDLMGVPLTRKVTETQPGSKTVSDWLNQAAEQLGVIVERPGLVVAKPEPEVAPDAPPVAPEPAVAPPPDDRLVVTVPLDKLTAQVADVLELSDFGDEAASAGQLIDSLIHGLSMQPRDQFHLRVLATDSLRGLRGLTPKLDAAVIDRWTVEVVGVLGGGGNPSPLAPLPETGRGERDRETLPQRWPELEGGESGSQLDTPITMAGLLRRTARLNEAACVINWDDARRRRLSPGQWVMPFAGQPAGEMLRQALGPIGLQVRVVDRSHWWVGTAATYDRLPIIVRGEPLGPRRDEILQAIRLAAARAQTVLSLQHDPVSDRYLAVLPRFLYRQLPIILKPFGPTN